MCTCMSLETLINYSHIHEHYLHIYYIFAYALFGYLLKRAKNQANSSIVLYQYLFKKKYFGLDNY